MTKKSIVGAIAAGLSLVAVADVEKNGSRDAFLLQTRTTSVVVVREDGTWRLKHFGERVESVEGMRALAWRGPEGYNSLGQRRDDAYSVMGTRNLTAGINKSGGLQVTHANGSVTTDLIVDGAEIVKDAEGVTHAILRSRDRTLPFYVVQHFRAIGDCDVVETWVELHHDEIAPVRLGRMDSLAMVLPHVADEFHVLQLTSQWGGEGHVIENAVARGQTVSFGARSGVRDAWGANPAFMLSVGRRADEESGRVISGALCWSGSWKIEIERDSVDLLEIRAGADTSTGAYVLDPGRTLTLPKVALTYSDAGKGQVSRNFHRWARQWRLPAGGKTRPVLLNSWEGAYFDFTETVLTNMMEGVVALGGEMFVLDDGWFGNGSFARDNDSVGLGDWQVNERKLPHGLGYLSAEAKKRGLKFGLWVEPEMANTESVLMKVHPDWALRDADRPLHCGRGKTQVVLDLANPRVVDAMYGQLDALYSSVPDLAYVKWDANCDIHNPGSTVLGKDRQANVWFDYTQGLYALLSRLRAKYPTMDIQACSSGGGHMDYGFLGFADEFWTSDDTDARERVFIQWGAGHFYPACAMACHVTASPNHQTKRVTPLKFRFDVAMSGRLGFELHPAKMTSDEIAFAKRSVKDYKRIRSVVQQGDLYRLRSPYESNHAALMYVSEDRSRAVVFVYGLSRALQSDWLVPIRLLGLDPKRQYAVREINRVPGKAAHSHADGKIASGAAFAGMGLPVTLKGDWDSAVFELATEQCGDKPQEWTLKR